MLTYFINVDIKEVRIRDWYIRNEGNINLIKHEYKQWINNNWNGTGIEIIKQKITFEYNMNKL